MHKFQSFPTHVVGYVYSGDIADLTFKQFEFSFFDQSCPYYVITL